MKVEFDRELLKKLAALRVGEILDESYVIVENEVYDTGRWSVYCRLIFCDPHGKAWKTLYSVGATEMQDQEPFEYDDCMATLVRPVEKTVIVYEEVEDA